jgi:hypothetical protein
MLPYAVLSRLYHSYRAVARRDSSILFSSERAAEIRWVYTRLHGMGSGLLLEVGDVLGPALVRTGFDVVTVDIRPREIPAVPGWSPLPEDVRTLRFSDRFDAAVSISTLEHIGMGHYGDGVDFAGDRKAVDAIHASLKIGGRLLATLPMGAQNQETWQRLYSVGRIHDLFERFRVRELTTYHFRWIAWRPVRAGGLPRPRTLGPTPPIVTCVAFVDAQRMN